MVDAGDENCRVLTVEAAGKVLGLGRSAAYAAANSGEIPTIRIGKLIRVSKAALEQMLNPTRPNAA